MKFLQRAFIWLAVTSLLIPGTVSGAVVPQKGQRNNQPMTARLIVQIHYEQEDNSQTGDIRTTAKLNLKLSYTRGVQFSSVPNANGSVDILNLPDAPVSAQGAINYSSQSESHSSDTVIFGSGTFAGNYKTPDASVSAFWAEEANALDIRLESHGELTGDCHEDITSNGKTQTSDDCTDVAGADTGLIDLDKFQPNKGAQTPDAKFKTKLRFNFDVIAAPTQDAATNAYLDYNDTTWRGGQTKGDAKAGYKVEFDGFKQFQQPNLSGKKHLILSAQIVPGAPAAANTQLQSPMVVSEDEVAPAVDTKKLTLGHRYTYLTH